MSGINIKKLSAARAEGLYVWLIKCGGKMGTGQEMLCCCPDKDLGGFHIFNPTLGVSRQQPCSIQHLSEMVFGLSGLALILNIT